MTNAAEMMKSPEVIAYLEELAADIAANGGFGGMPIERAIKNAHARRQNFAQEMVDCDTRRAKMARKAVMTSVFIEGNSRKYQEQQAQMARDSMRNFDLEIEFLGE